MEKEKLVELSGEIDKLVNLTIEYNKTVGRFKLAVTNPLDYAQADQLIKEGARYGFINKRDIKDLYVRLVTSSSIYNANLVSGYMNFNNAESKLAKSATDLGCILLTELLSVIKEKQEELAGSNLPIEERCLKQVEFENKLAKLLHWIAYVSLDTNHLSIDWENSQLNTPVDLCYTDISDKTVYEDVVDRIEFEIKSCSDGEGNGFFNNDWISKGTAYNQCTNVINFIKYL